MPTKAQIHAGITKNLPSPITMTPLVFTGGSGGNSQKFEAPGEMIEANFHMLPWGSG